jgi:hypothetical protein
MTLKEQLKAKITEIKLLFKDIDEPALTKLKLVDDKEIAFSGELKEGVEIKCADAAIADGVHELKDGRKITTKDGKFVSVESKPAPAGEDTDLKKMEAQFMAMKAVNESQASTIQVQNAKIETLLAGHKLMMASIESIAEHLERETAKPVGGGEGDGGMSKADWIVAQAKAGKTA